jgi:hypothetical protein
VARLSALADAGRLRCACFRKADLSMSSGSSENPAAKRAGTPHRVRVIIFRVVAVLAGLFFVVAVVLMASAPSVLLQPDQQTRTELNRWFLTVAGSVDAIAAGVLLALALQPRRALLIVEHAVTTSWYAPDLVKASQGNWHASRLNRLAPCCSDDRHDGDGSLRPVCSIQTHVLFAVEGQRRQRFLQVADDGSCHQDLRHFAEPCRQRTCATHRQSCSGRRSAKAGAWHLQPRAGRLRCPATEVKV